MSDEFEPECKTCGTVMDFVHEHDDCGSSSQFYWCSKCGTALIDWDDRHHWNEIEDAKNLGVVGEWKVPESHVDKTKAEAIEKLCEAMKGHEVELQKAATFGDGAATHDINGCTSGIESIARTLENGCKNISLRSIQRAYQDANTFRYRLRLLLNGVPPWKAKQRRYEWSKIAADRARAKCAADNHVKDRKGGERCSNCAELKENTNG